VRDVVPSYKHELLAELFEQRPDLAWRITAPLVGLSLEGAVFECTSKQLPEVREFRPDRLALMSVKGEVAAAAVIEVQLDWSDDKPPGWLCHLALTHSRYRCPVYLLVVTDDEGVARRARGPFTYGHPGLQLRPIVLSADNVPQVRDPAEAAKAPELALLSALAHRSSEQAFEIAEAAVLGTTGLSAEQMQTYVDLLLYCLTAAVRERLIVMLEKKHEPLSDYFKAKYREGIERGLEQGREQGRE
jgi:hypothetical protein